MQPWLNTTLNEGSNSVLLFQEPMVAADVPLAPLSAPSEPEKSQERARCENKATKNSIFRRLHWHKRTISLS